ncbi:hypothetical protein [Trichloromonas sp.]|jgi:hypothetical protein|uniref:hypothetical protein n=1 Tax=Trichloromonas sp. TaxID=3069249 RepID=UPI002A4628A1|nr:hypothetical protein [Trichloromonas sp.]
MDKIKVKIEKSWNGRYYTIKIPTDHISFELYEKIGNNLTESMLIDGLENGINYDNKVLKYPNDVTCCYYDNKEKVACLSSESINNINNWLNLYDDILYTEYNVNVI